jgi:hypothetical protein
MDAFAKGGHIRLIDQEDSGGYDYIVEALNNTSGVGRWRRSYRLDPLYDGIRRNSWNTTCPGY